MSDAAFRLLHPGVQRAIWDMGWTALRPIQEESIHVILGGNRHLLVCAGTAGGKTEAAFLPIISRVAEQPREGFRAMYVGPLKALINDQFERLERLCSRMEIPVHRWHGDVTQSRKDALRREPGGILLITPESLESNFINHGRQVPGMYRDLEFVVIDELHAFLGDVRGVHLLSLLSRLRDSAGCSPRMVGLSATLADPDMGRRFLAPEEPEAVHLIQDSGANREIRFALKAILPRLAEGRGDAGEVEREPPPAEDSLAIIESIRRKTRADLLAAATAPATSQSAADAHRDSQLDALAEDVLRHFAESTNLIFVNARRVAEELIIRLRERVRNLGWSHDPFVIHHGSVAKDLRSEAEAALKDPLPTTAICSSTLEMGIDIGGVRAVGQVDPPWSVASMVQRLGRSGRRAGGSAIMRLYVRERPPVPDASVDDLLFPDLLRAIAVTRLMQAKWLEPPDENRRHYSTLVHQILSHLAQTGGLTARQLHESLSLRGPFRAVTAEEFGRILRALGERGLIEQIPSGELILAPAGERLVGDYGFYAAFDAPALYAVRHGKTVIGELPTTSLPKEGSAFILAGSRWMVNEIDPRRKILSVSPSAGGEPLVFGGTGGEIHTRVFQEMRTVLLDADEPAWLDRGARALLGSARHVGRELNLASVSLIEVSDGIRWFPWIGTRGMRTLRILAGLDGLSVQTERLSIWLKADRRRFDDFRRRVTERPPAPAELGAQVTPAFVEKFDEHLPQDLLHQAAFHDRLDFNEALAAIRAA